jgi:hypothetical protein
MRKDFGIQNLANMIQGLALSLVYSESKGKANLEIEFDGSLHLIHCLLEVSDAFVAAEHAHRYAVPQE